MILAEFYFNIRINLEKKNVNMNSFITTLKDKNIKLIIDRILNARFNI